LNLPTGISTVDQSAVTVQVGVAAIEGSVTLTNIPVEIIGIAQNLQATTSPQTVNIILSGPLPILDNLKGSDIHVQIDLTGISEGTYQKVPEVLISKSDVQVQSIVPGTLNVIITKK
jgi:YbbR domain-containing protein